MYNCSDNSVSVWDKDEQNLNDITVIEVRPSPRAVAILETHPIVEPREEDMAASVAADCSVSSELTEVVNKLCREHPPPGGVDGGGGTAGVGRPSFGGNVRETDIISDGADSGDKTRYGVRSHSCERLAPPPPLADQPDNNAITRSPSRADVTTGDRKFPSTAAAPNTVSAARCRSVSPKDYFKISRSLTNISDRSPLSLSVVCADIEHSEPEPPSGKPGSASTSAAAGSGCQMPPEMSLSSCSLLVTSSKTASSAKNAAAASVPASRDHLLSPLHQLYGTPVADDDDGGSRRRSPAAAKSPGDVAAKKSSPVRHLGGPPATPSNHEVVNPDPSDDGSSSSVMSSIRLARSCSRNTSSTPLQRHSQDVTAAVPVSVRPDASGGLVPLRRPAGGKQRLENFRGGVVSMLATSDSRSTPWLHTAAANTGSTLQLPSGDLSTSCCVLQQSPLTLSSSSSSFLGLSGSRTSPLRYQSQQQAGSGMGSMMMGSHESSRDTLHAVSSSTIDQDGC